tara:strand:+ start:7211 stop:7504 length:294 start_codon:yes stop_codon:yes gene_type:complete
MRRFDKKVKVEKANLIAEQRYLASKGLVKEGETDSRHMSIQKEITDYPGVKPIEANISPLKNELIEFVEWLDNNVSYNQHSINMSNIDDYIRNKDEQ